MRCLIRALVMGIAISHGGSPPVSAQQPGPVTRADLTGTLGWLSVRKDEAGPYDGNDWHDSLFAAASAGWYWTDHLKTEMDFGASNEATAYRGRPIVIEGYRTFESTRATFSRRVLAISQQYQFFRNAWFHPHLAAGVNIAWERTTDHVEPVFVYDDVSRTGRVVQPGRTDGPRTDIDVSPFVATGFKAYLTQRGFFRSDLRVTVRDGVDDVWLRFGFGVDFGP